MIEYRNVHKAFDLPVLRGVSLRVETGEMLSIVGSSGTGKSVLLKTTNGLLLPDAGDVLVDGESVFASRAALERVRRKVGYVFQYAALFDSMTVLDNVRSGLPEDEAAARDAVSRVCDALVAVNLDPAHVLGKLPSELSGGMRKRVGVARAIVGRPDILLYDEPVTGLDPVNSAAIANLVMSIREKTGVTSVLVTHDVEQALDISDRVALLDSGRVRFAGTPGAFRACDDPVVRAFADRRVAAETVALWNVMDDANGKEAMP